MPTNDTLSGSLIITDEVFDSVDKFEERIKQLNATMDSAAKGWKEQFKELADTISSSVPKDIDVKVNMKGVTANELRDVAKAANELGKAGANGALSLTSFTEREEKINRDIEESLKKRSDTYASIIQRIREMENTMAGLEALDARTPQGFTLSEQSLNNYTLAEERIASLQERIRLLGLEYDSTRAKSHLDLAISMPENTLDDVRNKLTELQKAKEEFLRPGTSGSEADRTAGLMEVDDAIENLMPKYERLAAEEKKAAKAASELEKENRKLAKEQQKIGTATTKLSDAMGLSENDVASIKEKMRSIQSAVKELRSALKNPVGGTPEIRNAEAEYDRLKDKLKELKGATDDAGAAASSAGRIFAQAFSMYSVTRLLKEIVNVYGQFQMTERSLGVIIGDTVKARDIFNEIKGIAIESPFQVSDLADYAKQLAAFRIDTDLLIEKTQMLGDLSAGLGVEMGRLILAYGQVRSANYLKLTEVRQFTEGGVDLLGGLADKFSEVEKRAVTVGEVMNRITKRMVTFKDVDEVLTKMTSLGGTFYNMQKQQAETVMGLISNLKDRWEIAMNEIGSNSDGTIRNIISLVTSLIDHASALEVVLKSAIWGYGMAMSVKMLISGLGGISSAINSISRALKALGSGSFSAMAKSANVYAAAIGAAAAAVSLLVVALGKRKELQKDLAKLDAESASDQLSLISKYSILTNKINDQSRSIRERKEVLGELKAAFGQILPLEDASIENIKALNAAYSEHIDIIKAYSAAKNQEAKKTAIAESVMKKSAKTLEDYKSRATTLVSSLLNMKGYAGFTEESLMSDIKTLYEAFQQRIIDGDEDLLNFLRNDMSGLSKAFGQELASFFNIEDLTKGWDWKQLDILFDPYKKVKDDIINLYSQSSIPAINFKTKDIQAQIASVKKLYQDHLADLLAMPEYEQNRAKAVGESQKWIYDQLFGDPSETNLGIKKRIDQMFESGDIGEEVRKKLEAQMNSAYSRVSLSPIEKILNENFDRINAAYDNLRFPMGTGATAWDDSAQIDDYAQSVINARDSLNALIDALVKAQNAADAGTTEGMAKISLAWQQLGYDSLESARDQLAAYDMLIKILPQLSKEKASKKKSSSSSKSQEDEVQRNLKALGEAMIDYYKVMDSVNPDVIQAKWEKILTFKGKFGISLPDKAALDTATIESWLTKTLYPQIKDTTVSAELNVKFKEAVSSKTEDSLKKAADAIKKRIQYALEFDELDIQVEGLDLVSLYSQLEQVAAQFRAIPSESAQREADSIAEYIRNIYADAQNKAIKDIAMLNRKAATGISKIFSDYADNLKSIQDASNGSDTTGVALPQEFFDSAKLNAQKKLLSDLDAEVWNLYKSTEMYMRSFGNLDDIDLSVLEQLKTQLEGIAASQQDLSPADSKAIANALRDIEDAISGKNMNSTGFFDTMIKGMKSIREEYVKIQPALENAQNAQQKYSDALLSWQSMKDDLSVNPESYTDAEMEQALKRLTDAQTEYDDALKEYFNQVNRTKQSTSRFKNQIDSLHDGVSKVGDAFNSAVDLVSSLAEAFGLTFGEETQAAIDGMSKGFSIASSAITAMSIASTALELGLFGADKKAKSLMGTLWPLLAVATALGAAIAIVQVADKKKQKAVEKQKDLVEELQKTYDKLGDSMEQAMNIEQLREYNRLLEYNISLQKTALETAIKIEESRGRKKDKESIKDMKEQLAELDDQMKKIKESLMELLGAETDYAGMAGDWADAWLESFNETGDGLDALLDDFDSFWNKMIAAQVKYQVFGKYFEELKANVESWLADLKIDQEENQRIQEMRNELWSLNEQAKKLMEDMGLSTGIVSTPTTTLKGDVQNITETQASAIEGYLNSVRFYVAQIYRLQQDYVASMNVKSPILSELKAQTELVMRIENLMDSVIRSGHRVDGGNGIKVFLD